MKDRPNRPSRSAPPTRSAPPSGRPRSSQRGGGRQQKPNPRNRQLFAVGALVLVLAVIAAIIFLPGIINPNPPDPALNSSLPNESVGHFRGDANAPVTVTEWSDYQ